jgi:hypothetical protein
VQNKLQIVRLFKNAGIQDQTLPSIDPIGFGYVQTSHPTVFNNLTFKRNDFVNATIGMFYESIGVYRYRMLETINPLYWIESIIFLPKTLLNYLGVSPESVVIKIVQLFYWVISAFILFFLGLYRAEFENIVRDLIAKIIH